MASASVVTSNSHTFIEQQRAEVKEYTRVKENANQGHALSPYAAPISISLTHCQLQLLTSADNYFDMSNPMVRAEIQKAIRCIERARDSCLFASRLSSDRPSQDVGDAYFSPPQQAE